MALPLHSNPPWGLSLTTLPPPLLPTTRIHFPLRSTSLRVSIQMKEAPLRVILWAEVRRGCSSAQYLVLDIHLQGRQYRKPLFQAMKRQLCFNFHYKVYRCLAVLVGCVRQCPEPSLYYNIKIFFFYFPTGYSLFQPVILFLLLLVIYNLCHSCMMLCPNLVLQGYTCPHMSSAALFCSGPHQLNSITAARDLRLLTVPYRQMAKL